MNIDFENDFTASLATVLFVGLSAVAAIWLFVSLWLGGGSLLMAIVFFVLIAPFAAIGVGIITALASWAIALLVAALRLGIARQRRV